MTQSDVFSDSVEITLLRGAMQNWSDLALGSLGDSALVRRLLEGRADGVQSVLVVGAHSLELMVGIAQSVPRLDIVTRSIPDARSIADALRQVDGARVFCGGLDDLVVRGETYDLVIALDDLDRVVSQESEAPPWSTVLDQVRQLVADGGTVVLGVENEIGLHRISSLRSPYTANDDGDWAVLSTFDTSRPRTVDQVVSAVEAAGLAPGEIHSTYAQWLNPTILARPGAGEAAPGDPAAIALGLLCLAAPAGLGGLADAARLTRVTSGVGLLGALASGWVVVAHTGSREDRSREDTTAPTFFVDSGHELVAFDVTPEGLRRRESGAPTVPLDPAATLLSEEVVDACAAHRLPDVRRLLQEYVAWLEAEAVDGELDAHYAAAALHNVVRTGDVRTVLLPGTGPTTVADRAWRSLGELVALLRRRGARHPWPAATDDRTLISILAAMAGLEAVADPSPYLKAGSEDIEPTTHTVAGLLAVVERLTESNTALQSRANWFERRLNERERELRTIATTHERELRVEQARQEALRRSVADIKGSLSFRAGRIVMSPVIKARDAARKLRD